MNEVKEYTGGFLSNVEPTGNMVLCNVISFDGEEDQALWGNSGAMGEPYSFFEPYGGKFKAMDINVWALVIEGDDYVCPYCHSDSKEVKEIFFSQTCAGCIARMKS